MGNIFNHKILKGHEGKMPVKSAAISTLVYFVPFVVRLLPVKYGEAVVIQRFDFDERVLNRVIFDYNFRV